MPTPEIYRYDGENPPVQVGGMSGLLPAFEPISLADFLALPVEEQESGSFLVTGMPTLMNAYSVAYKNGVSIGQKLDQIEIVEDCELVIWDSNYFTGHFLEAKRVGGKDILIRARFLNNIALSANTVYNCLLVQKYNPSTNVILNPNYITGVGTTGADQVTGILMPLASNTSAIQLYCCSSIPVNSTMYFQGYLATNY